MKLKRITILVGSTMDPTPIRLDVPAHYTEKQARAQYFVDELERWKAEPLETVPQKLPDGVERFFKRLKMMSDTNVVELGSRAKLAARLGVSLSKVVHCINKLRECGLVETKRLNNNTIKAYYLKY